MHSHKPQASDGPVPDAQLENKMGATKSGSYLRKKNITTFAIKDLHQTFGGIKCSQ